MAPTTPDANAPGGIAPYNDNIQTEYRHQSGDVISRTIEKIGAAVSLDRSKVSIANTLTGRHSWSDGGKYVAHIVDDLDFLAQDMRGRTVLITGSSRGIGEAIAVRCAQAGANVAIVAKTTSAGKGVFGTIHTAAQAVEAAGGRALAIRTDLTREADVKSAVARTVAEFGGVDVLVNNASAIWTKGTEETDTRHYDYVTRVCQRGTYLATRACMPHLLKSDNPHVLTVAPAPMADPEWLAPHVMYSAAKIGMGFLSLAMRREYHGTRVAFNTLWPYYCVATAAVNMLGGEELINRSMSVAHMADPAFRILCTPSESFSGNHCLDVHVLASLGVEGAGRGGSGAGTNKDGSVYRVVPESTGKVALDFMVESRALLPRYTSPELLSWPTSRPDLCLAGRRVIVTGAAYGMGRAVALELAAQGAALALVGGAPDWMAAGHQPLEAIAKSARKTGAANCIALACDLTAPQEIDGAIAEAARRLGGVDCVALFASTAALVGTADAGEKEYDMMADYMVRSGFVVVRESLRHLRASTNPHVLWLAPPPTADAAWLAPHVAFGMAAINKGMYACGMAEELRGAGIAVNALWPRVPPLGAEAEVFAGGPRAVAAGYAPPPGRGRLPTAMARAASLVLTRELTGHFLDEEVVLTKEDPACDLAEYSAAPGTPLEDLPAGIFTARLSRHVGTTVGGDGVTTEEKDSTLPGYGGPRMTFPSHAEQYLRRVLGEAG